MNNHLIAVGASLEFELFNAKGEKLSAVCAGEVMEILSDKAFIIFTTGQGMPKLKLLNGIRLCASSVHPLHGFLRVDGALVRIKNAKNGFRLYVNIDENYQVVQSREYFRPPSFLKTQYRLAAEPCGAGPESPWTPYKIAKTKDVSFRGVCIIVDEADDIAQGSLIDLIIWLKCSIHIKIRCKVMRIIPVETNGKNTYEVGMLIEEMSDYDALILTEYITRHAIIEGIY